METGLELLMVEGERRIVALGIHVQHDNLMQTIRKYQSGLEKYGLILFETEAVKHAGARGVKHVKYALLNKEQFGYLLMFVRITDRVREYREHVYDKFLEYERLKSASSEEQPRIHTFTDALRPRALENLNSVPDGYFSVLSELFKHLYNLEALLNQSIDNKAMLEISVGQLWSKHARDVLTIPDHLRHKYKHHSPGGYVVEAWAYPMLYANTFAKWLWSIYFPLHFPSYQQYRTKRIAQPARKQLHQGKGA